MIDRLIVAQKSGGMNLDVSISLEKAKEDIERADRIAKLTVNKTAFMPLGDKQPKLVSEEGTYNIQKNVVDPWANQSRDDSYLTDDSIPADVFTLIY